MIHRGVVRGASAKTVRTLSILKARTRTTMSMAGRGVSQRRLLSSSGRASRTNRSELARSFFDGPTLGVKK